MKNSGKHLLFSFMQIIFIILSLLCFTTRAEANFNKKVSGFYVFGDSTVDPGNNNYIDTLFKSNFQPYGKDFTNHVPSGRFTNGKLATDFIASYVGVKKELLPAYLDPNVIDNVNELMTGVSFASAGSGFDPLTPSISSVIPIPKQLEYFRECKKKLENVIGIEGTENHIKKAVFFMSAGTNDFALNYFTLPVRRNSFSLLGYQQFLIQRVKEFLQELLAEGAQKIVIAGVPPMGCLPFMITMNSPNAFLQRNCIERFSSAAKDYNQLLQQELNTMQFHLNSSNSPAKIYYIDIYQPLANMVQAHQKYGFEDINSGCCGSGYIEAALLCNKECNVCSDPSKYMFWDSIHPTEKAYYNLFLAFKSTIDCIVNN
ncbi:unnamed protein product [Lathyrus oleraceus]|uniref:GDSL esterase/lipase n=1 Tax=Pisum sativum TaxID=3888 RepID=A0A9D5H0T1_PEA|nr:GDSL esterase/lipase At5g45960-like [Pisum sativum]KAI5447874.1 hypothetical protein KIW84_015354 [Pisum sativum]